MSAYLSPIGNEPQIDTNGDPLSGAKWWTYVAGTSTPAATYTDSTGVTPLSNPIILNSRGMPTTNGTTPASIWIAGGASLKFILTDANDVPIAPTFDNIQGVNDPAVASTVDQWVQFTGTPSYISSISFSVAGDQTGVFTVNRRVKTTNTGGSIYSTVGGSSYNGGTGLTTVTLANDTGSLDAGLSIVRYGLLTPDSPSIPANFNPFGLVRTLSSSVGGNVLTFAVTLKQLDFRSSTASNGAVSSPAGTVGTLTVPSTATMGQSNGVAARLWVALIYTGSALELAVINTQLGNGQIHPINESGFISTTAMSTAADNAGVWYSTSARSNVPFRLIGYVENTQAAAGTWVTNPSLIQPMGPGVRKPGDIIQRQISFDGTVLTDTTILPGDNTIPQVTEGAQYLVKAITPTSDINTLRVEAQGMWSSNAAAGTVITAALFQGVGPGALRAAFESAPAVSYAVQLKLQHQQQAGSTSSVSFSVRAGASAAGTTTFNGTAGGQLMGGVSNSFIEVLEIMA